MSKNNSALSTNVYNKNSYIQVAVANLKSKRRATTSDTYNTIITSSFNSYPYNLYTPSIQSLPDAKLNANSRAHLYCYFDVNRPPCLIYIETATATNLYYCCNLILTYCRCIYIWL